MALRKPFIGLLCTLAFALPPAQATELRAAVFAPMGSTWSKPFEQWAQKINAQGSLKIRLIGPEALAASAQPLALKRGEIDMIATPPGTYKSLMAEANAQELSNLSLAEQRASGGYEALNQLLRERLNAFALTSYGHGVAFHLYLSEPIAQAEQLVGLRVRSQALQNPFLQALGMHTVTMAIPEVVDALDYHLIQGYAFTLWGIEDFGWHYRTAQRIDPGFYNVVVNVLINQDRWNRLSNKEQALLIETSQWLEHEQAQLVEQKNREAKMLQTQNGIEVLDFGPRFAEKAQAVYWQTLEDKSPTTIPHLKRLLMK